MKIIERDPSLHLRPRTHMNDLNHLQTLLLRNRQSRHSIHTSDKPVIDLLGKTWPMLQSLECRDRLLHPSYPVHHLLNMSEMSLSRLNNHHRGGWNVLPNLPNVIGQLLRPLCQQLGHMPMLPLVLVPERVHHFILALLPMLLPIPLRVVLPLYQTIRFLHLSNRRKRVSKEGSRKYWVGIRNGQPHLLLPSPQPQSYLLLPKDPPLLHVPTRLSIILTMYLSIHLMLLLQLPIRGL
jgi:hypothetical protein